MNLETFRAELEALPEKIFQAVIDGEALKVENDAGFVLGRPDDAYVLYELGTDIFNTPLALKQHLLDNATEYRKEYYQFNPLSRAAFDKQLTAHMQARGWDAFSAYEDETPAFVLFVEDGNIIVEDENSIRFKYGFYHVLEVGVRKTAIENKVKNWVQSGIAYQEYISTNVCRFSALE